jgi:hypothetical protein
MEFSYLHHGLLRETFSGGKLKRRLPTLGTGIHMRRQINSDPRDPIFALCYRLNINHQHTYESHSES